MGKTIILTEKQAKRVFGCKLNEAAGDLRFGRDPYNATDLSRIKSLPNFTFKYSRMEDAFDDWKDAGFERMGPEFVQYMSSVDYFKNNVLRGLQNSIENKKARRVPFHYLLLDPGWMRLMIQSGDRMKETGENEAEGKNSGFRCLFTLILTIYQNPTIWNDYCFNPEFEGVRNLVSGLVKEAISLNQDYKQLLPLEQLKAINMFKANQDNAHPELFYTENWRNEANLRTSGDEESDFD